MALVTTDMAKAYLRVDSDFDDGVIESLLVSAENICIHVARLTEEQWELIDSDEESSTDYSEAELSNMRSCMKIATLYCLGYLYEHREEADHHQLILTLRSLLFAIREEVI